MPRLIADQAQAGAQLESNQTGPSAAQQVGEGDEAQHERQQLRLLLYQKNKLVQNTRTLCPNLTNQIIKNLARTAFKTELITR
jgi:hypothetical protein